MKKASSFKELSPDQLRWTLDINDIPFTTSNDCEACTGIIGQNRALNAIQTEIGGALPSPKTDDSRSFTPLH